MPAFNSVLDKVFPPHCLDLQTHCLGFRPPAALDLRTHCIAPPTALTGTTKEAVGTEPMRLKFFSGARDVDAGNERLTDLDSESEEDAQDEWAVESIEDRKEGEGGTLYLVRWAVPHDDEHTWESADDVAGAAARVQAFEQRLLV